MKKNIIFFEFTRTVDSDYDFLGRVPLYTEVIGYIESCCFSSLIDKQGVLSFKWKDAWFLAAVEETGLRDLVGRNIYKIYGWEVPLKEAPAYFRRVEFEGCGEVPFCHKLKEIPGSLEGLQGFLNSIDKNTPVSWGYGVKTSDRDFTPLELQYRFVRGLKRKKNPIQRIAEYINNKRKEPIMAAEVIGKVKSGKGRNIDVKWDASSKDVYVRWAGTTHIGKASSGGEAMRKADAWLWDK